MTSHTCTFFAVSSPLGSNFWLCVWSNMSAMQPGSHMLLYVCAHCCPIWMNSGGFTPWGCSQRDTKTVVGRVREKPTWDKFPLMLLFLSDCTSLISWSRSWSKPWPLQSLSRRWSRPLTLRRRGCRRSCSWSAMRRMSLTSAAPTEDSELTANWPTASLRINRRESSLRLDRKFLQRAWMSVKLIKISKLYPSWTELLVHWGLLWACGVTAVSLNKDFTAVKSQIFNFNLLLSQNYIQTCVHVS